ncbi:MAG: tricorn protease-like protein, partial [Psychromonas sp.]
MYSIQMTNNLILSILFCATLSSRAQENPTWDVTEPALPYTEINIETDEGTWMNLDVSPDGSQVVFDMLGDIYMMPISGGRAELISGGHAFEVQPRFSPTGKKISFTSDRGGADNIWMMNIDGSEATQ